jgi:hypothetical protein
VNIEQITAAIDAEIERLQQARIVIAGSADGGKRRGRPPGSGSQKPAKKKPAKKKRALSAAAREKIAAAQRKRWAKQKQVVVTKVPPKHAPVKRPRQVSVKAKTALTGNVPTGPVAGPASKG